MTETELPHPKFGLHSSLSLSYFWPYRPKSATVWSAIKDQLCLHIDLQKETVFYLAATGQSSSLGTAWLNEPIRKIHSTSTEQNYRPSPLNVTKLEMFLTWWPEGTSPHVTQNMKSHIPKTEWKEINYYMAPEIYQWSKERWYKQFGAQPPTNKWYRRNKIKTSNCNKAVTSL